MNRRNLEVPPLRKSVEVINDLRCAHLSVTLDHGPQPTVTSTVERRPCESFNDPYTISNYFKRGAPHSANGTQDESSLGLLDIDKDLERTNLVSKLPSDFRSLSFNAKEMTGRSTYIHSSKKLKENRDPCSDGMVLPLRNTMCIEDILRDASKQSEAVDGILKESDNPNVANIRMSLNSYKQSISSTGNRESNVWNYRSEDFGCNTIGEQDPDMRDSMFVPADKVDMSKEELSWMKEHGDLPVPPTSATFTSGSDKNVSNQYATTLANDTANDFLSLKSNVSNISKFSVGNYFKRRSANISNILSAPSPEKVGPFPALFDPEDEKMNSSVGVYNGPAKLCETYKKSHVSKSLPFHTLSDDSALSDREMDQQHTTHEDVAVLTHVNNKFNIPSSRYSEYFAAIHEETSLDSPISHSQIRNVIENYDIEKKSLVLDKLIAKTKSKGKGARNTRAISPRVQHGSRKDHCEKQKNESTIRNISPSLPEKSSFGHASNIFHSTVRGEEVDRDKCDKKRSNVSVFENDDYSSGFISASKNCGKSNSGSSGFTESSMKSAATVIQVKVSNILKPIKEVNDKNNVVSPVMGNDSFNKCAGRVSRNDLVSSSDVSKEILNIMSPASSSKDNLSSPNNIQAAVAAGHHPERKINHDEWISPMKAKLNNLSSECIPSNTPYRTEKISCVQSNSKIHTEVSDSSINVPLPGDWISVESQEGIMIAGNVHDIDLKLSSLCRRWISVEISLDNVCTDDRVFNDQDIPQVMLIKPLTGPILLNADSQMTCKLSAVAFVPNELFKVNVSLKLTDMVTKMESTVKHSVTLLSKLPQFKVMCEAMKSDEVHFPSIPQQYSVCVPIILFNCSNSDITLKLNISCPHQGIFSFGEIETISADSAMEILSTKMLSIYKNVQSDEKGQCIIKDLPNVESFTISKDNSVCAKILLCYNSPCVQDLENVKTALLVDGTLYISVVPQWKTDVTIPLKKIPLTAGVGLCKLLVRNKQGSSVLTVSQGSSESLWLMNGGTLKLYYQIYIADHYDGYTNWTELVPSKNPMFSLDKTDICLNPGEKISVNVTYPTSNQHTPKQIQRTLTFKSMFATEVFDVIGVGPRSASQQSVCSVDSAASQLRDICIKSNKREMSWGSLKIDSCQVKDVALKNTSTDKKIRITACIQEKCFKLMGENGPVSSLIVTLLPQECKTLRIEFRPNKAGVFAGFLRISHGSRNTVVTLLCKIMLHGVGDTSMLVFKDGVFKHGGSQGIPLGSLNDFEDCKDINFSIWNKGTAAAFFILNLELKWKYRMLGEEIKVIPQYGIMAANSIVRCVVRVPRKPVMLARGKCGDTENLATLTILHGDDSTRLRIKRICSENVVDESLKEKWNKESLGKLDSLCMNFPEENHNYGNFVNFKETQSALKLLLDELQQKEVVLTYDVDLDNTVLRASSELDDTVQFHTMCTDNTQNTVCSEF